MKRAATVGTCVCGALALAACGGGATTTVYAASSLTDVLAEIVETTAVDAELVFAGSSQLAAQLEDGAPASLFVSANEAAMQQVVAAGRVVGEPVAFASNSLVLVTPPGNPGSVRGLDDLAARADELLVAVCAAPVPCGELTAQMAEARGIELSPDTLEASVRSVLTKVALGEVDAGLVYRTDVPAADVEVIDVPGLDTFTTVYSAALLDDSPAARDLLGALTSASGRSILTDHGFGPP